MPSGHRQGVNDDYSDRDLWEAAAGGQSSAFGILFRRHARAVYNHCFRRTADWSVAEDLTSLVFCEAWRRHAEVVLDRESALPWLLGVANGVVANQRRARRRYAAALAKVPPPPDVPDPADDVVGRLDDQRRMAEVRAAVSRLAAHDREVLELCVWAGLDMAAASVALGVPVGTVKSRLSRARRKLSGLVAIPALDSLEGTS